ncbi:MFS gliotoxin efflux transporter glia [Melanomma pulvis-pyrius CBS 109.77]|uniref:MFS gliotoxin efflux transporter glia n=1 Tax=Melanomma pulvis-pyrius CBS 109.77 TaxID=1314802 RepID=A0A6A6XVW7_9PLEO|nr:MFS gliotoxin efflux transporter glia [Melanomma pulvis-pyrius CBS 109.77]
MKFILITIGLVLSIFLSALDTTIIATAIPSITDDFGSISNIAWYGSAYIITNTAFQSSWGKCYMYFPLKTTFLLAITVFEIGNVICGIAPNSSTLILGRVVAGIGGGGIMTGAFIIIALTVKPDNRAAYMGVLGVTFGVSSVVGPLMGGLLTDGPGWRWCFWISLPLGFSAATTMFFFFTPREASLRERLVQIDLLGSVLVTGALSCFVLSMHWSGVYHWSSLRAILSMVAFTILMLVFFVNEWLMGDKAMVQHHLLKNPSVIPNVVYIFFLAGLYFPLLYTLPVQLQSVHNASASQSGVRLIPLVLGISIFTMVANGLLTFWRQYKFFLVAGAILGTAGVTNIYTLGADASTGDWIRYEVLAAVGVGLALQIPMIANQTVVAAGDVPAVTSLTLFVENMGTTLFVAAGEAAFAQGLMASIAKNVPSVEPHAVLDIGATQIRQVFSGNELQGVLGSYLDGCKISHIIGVACGVAACLVSFGSAGTAIIKEVKMRMKKMHVP